ncbi:MAG: hypothetical protein KDD76_05805, partial [Rickettsiales bacterium]|nr:hypothetical protein [Rickettsiales bacterium]
DLQITDRIDLVVEAEGELKEAIAANQNYIAEQTLASVVTFGASNGKPHKADLEVEGQPIAVGFDVVG